MVDAVVAVAAFGLSAAVLMGADPVADDLREPDVVAYVLVAVYSALPIVRRWAPVVAVFGGLVTGVAFAAAQYPVALTPVVLLSIYTAAAVLPPTRRLGCCWRPRLCSASSVRRRARARPMSACRR